MGYSLGIRWMCIGGEKGANPDGSRLTAPPAALGAMRNSSSRRSRKPARCSASLRRPTRIVSAREQQRLALAVSRFLCGAAQASGGLCLIFDDLQWLDENSLRAIERLVSDVAAVPAMLILIVRATPGAPPPPVISGLRKIDLGPMPVAGIAANSRPHLRSPHGQRGRPRGSAPYPVGRQSAPCDADPAPHGLKRRDLLGRGRRDVAMVRRRWE